MKDKELKLEETEASHTLGGVSNTLKYINLTGLHRTGCVTWTDAPACMLDPLGLHRTYDRRTVLHFSWI
jgi:hypothetical protein